MMLIDVEQIHQMQKVLPEGYALPRGKGGTVNRSFLTSRASSFKPKQPIFSGVASKLGIPIRTY